MARKRDPILEAAVKKAGSFEKLGKLIGVSRQAVFLWRRCPPQYAIPIERVTGISRHELRPDLYPRED